MKTTIQLMVVLIFCLASGKVFPCGGGLGAGLDIGDTQTILVRHNAGEETYVFNPDFCGEAADFGLILPVPSILSEAPTLENQSLLKSFDSLTAPNVVYEDRCYGEDWGMDAGMSDGGYDDAGADTVLVIDSGQVGMLDYSVLQATDTTAFTDWLDVNQYPYDDAVVPLFTHYVDKSWYFIAFKVSAAQEAPPAGTKVCGSFGPIRFSFSSETPVIPARIAALGGGAWDIFSWRIHVLASEPLSAQRHVDDQILRYTGEVTAAQIAEYNIGTIAEEGDMLTSLDVAFYGYTITDDISLYASHGSTSYRRTITHYNWVYCDDTELESDTTQESETDTIVSDDSDTLIEDDSTLRTDTAGASDSSTSSPPTDNEDTGSGTQQNNSTESPSSSTADLSTDYAPGTTSDEGTSANEPPPTPGTESVSTDTNIQTDAGVQKTTDSSDGCSCKTVGTSKGVSALFNLMKSLF